MAQLIENRAEENLRLRAEFCREHHDHGPEITEADHIASLAEADRTPGSEDTRASE